MTQEEKFEKIISWYAQVNEEDTKELAKQENIQKIREVEELMNESFPKEILSLYNKYDGDTGTGYGICNVNHVKLSEIFDNFKLDYENTFENISYAIRYH